MNLLTYLATAVVVLLVFGLIADTPAAILGAVLVVVGGVLLACGLARAAALGDRGRR